MVACGAVSDFGLVLIVVLLKTLYFLGLCRFFDICHNKGRYNGNIKLLQFCMHCIYGNEGKLCTLGG